MINFGFDWILYTKNIDYKTRYFDTLSDLQFSPYVPIQLIPVVVERSKGTPTGTSRLRASILQDWTHHTFISCFLHILRAEEKSSPQETKGLLALARKSIDGNETSKKKERIKCLPVKP